MHTATCCNHYAGTKLWNTAVHGSRSTTRLAACIGKWAIRPGSQFHPYSPAKLTGYIRQYMCCYFVNVSQANPGGFRNAAGFERPHSCMQLKRTTRSRLDTPARCTPSIRIHTYQSWRSTRRCPASFGAGYGLWTNSQLAHLFGA